MMSTISFQDSNIDWVGEIPSTWEVKRGKYLFSSKKELNTEYQCDNLLSLTLFGVLNKNMKSSEGLRPLNYTTYQVFGKDDLVFKLIDLENKQTSRVGLVHEQGIMSPVYIRLISKGKSLPKYYYYQYYDLYKKYIFNYLGSGVRSSLSPSDLLEIPLIYPSLEIQFKIVSFLDNKVQKIDELLEKTEKKIELLKENRTSLINHCVTKGLNPDVEMKDSGVEWIGEIPNDWDVKKLKYVSDIFSSSVDRHIHQDEIQSSICHYPDVYNNEFINNEIELNKGSCSEVEFQRYILKKGLVILTKDSETPDDIGNPCYVEIDFDNVVCGYHLTIIKNNDINVNSKFLFRFIQSDKVRCHFETESRGITRFSLGKSKIENLFVNLPSYSEQTKIAEYLDQQTQKIDITIAKETQRIKLLKEYRQSLISEVVTGKIDVRKWQE